MKEYCVSVKGYSNNFDSLITRFSNKEDFLELDDLLRGCTFVVRSQVSHDERYIFLATRYTEDDKNKWMQLSVLGPRREEVEGRLAEFCTWFEFSRDNSTYKVEEIDLGDEFYEFINLRLKPYTKD